MQHTNTFSQNGMVLVSTCFHKGGAKGKVLSFFQTLSNCLCLGCVSKKGPCKDSLEEGTHTKTHSLKCTTVYSYIYICLFFVLFISCTYYIYTYIYCKYYIPIIFLHCKTCPALDQPCSLHACGEDTGEGTEGTGTWDGTSEWLSEQTLTIDIDYSN